MNWHGRLARALFVVASIGAMVMSAVANGSWGSPG